MLVINYILITCYTGFDLTLRNTFLNYIKDFHLLDTKTIETDLGLAFIHTIETYYYCIG